VLAIGVITAREAIEAACLAVRGGEGRAASAATAMLALGLGLGGFAASARADFQVRSPIVDEGEVEIEHNGSVSFDKSNSGLNNDQSYTYSIGYGVTRFWMTELEGESGAEPGHNLHFDATTWENVFQLTPQGEYWADLGFFAEYSRAADRGAADSITFGPILQKEWGSSLHTANLFFSKEVGQGRSDATGFEYAWQSRYRWHRLAEPGIEFYGEIPDLNAPGKAANQQHRLGPVVVGALGLAPWGNLKYELGYLFGLTRATENGVLRWKIEYEIPF
jgi:hypothetical protein